MIRNTLLRLTTRLAMVSFAGLASLGMPSIASASLIGDSVDATLTVTGSPLCIFPPFICTTATVNGVAVVAGQEPSLDPILVEGVANYSINIGGSGFTVSLVTSSGSGGSVEFQVVLGDLDWVGMPTVVLDSVTADGSNPGGSSISFTDHGTIVDIAGGVSVSTTPTTWSFSFSTRDTAQAPEPASMALVALGLLGLVGVRRRTQTKGTLL